MVGPQVLVPMSHAAGKRLRGRGRVVTFPFEDDPRRPHHTLRPNVDTNTVPGNVESDGLRHRCVDVTRIRYAGIALPLAISTGAVGVSPKTSGMAGARVHVCMFHHGQMM